MWQIIKCDFKLQFAKSIEGKLIKVGHQSFLEAMLNDLFNGLDWNNVQAFYHVTRQVSQVFFVLVGNQDLSKTWPVGGYDLFFDASNRQNQTT